MSDDSIGSLLSAFQEATGVGAAWIDELPRDVMHAAYQAIPSDGVVTELLVANRRYLACRAYPRLSAIVAFGPYRRPDDPPCDCPEIDAAAEGRLLRTLGRAQVAIGQILEDRAHELEIASQFEMISDAVIAIGSELSLEVVLRRIVDLAREVVGARYAALGIPDEQGGLAAFLTSGIGEEDAAQIGLLPHGNGILGLLLRDPKVLRLADLASHPESVGFPPNHPPMKSFLGVPIAAGGRVLGNLYLTEKRVGSEFSQDDARLVEILARHAAVAIEHAELYERIESTRQQLRFIVDQMPEAVIVVGRDPERILVANRQSSELLGWDIETPQPLDRFLRRNPRFWPDGTPLDSEQVHIVRALRGEEVVAREEIEMDREDGSRIALLVNAAPLRDERGRVIAAVVVFQDITQIKDAEKLKDEFLSLVSHELRTPLTTIHGGAHLLLHNSEQLDAETHDQVLRDVLSESRRLAILVENMVQLANIRAGRFTMDTEPVLVRSVVEQAVAAARSRDPDRPLTAHVEPNLLALGDTGRLTQVLQNLVSNAQKYSPAGSPIEIDAVRDGAMVRISVRDHGPGIDAETLPLLFQRFERGERARQSGVTGMGLGLYLVKHLVEAHGGSVAIEPASGGGTIASFTIPALDEEI